MQPNGVDLYVGGAEHAVLHLLYARFWHKVLYDYGLVSSKEPFAKLFHQGLIMGEDGRKMSKSLGNVINPDQVVAEYGADSLRIFEMFLGPLQDSKPWSKTGIEGISRFLNRAWRLIANEDGTLSAAVADIEMDAEQEFHVHTLVKKVAEDIENLHFNTAVAQMMIFVNEFTKLEKRSRIALERFVLCLAPFAPHVAEELWRILGHTTSVVLESYPEWDDSKTVRNTIEFVVQVASKIRAKLQVDVDIDQAQIEELARKDEKVASYLEGKTIRKVIFVKNKLINFIV